MAELSHQFEVRGVRVPVGARPFMFGNTLFKLSGKAHQFICIHRLVFWEIDTYCDESKGDTSELREGGVPAHGGGGSDVRVCGPGLGPVPPSREKEKQDGLEAWP